MGLTQDLESIREKTAQILDECNAVAKLMPADTLSDVPRLITEAGQVGYGEGEQAGYDTGYEYGAGDTRVMILQNTNPVIEKYTAPADTVGELPARIDEVHAVGVGVGKQAAYDAFWDAYQENGQRANYDRAFGGSGWTLSTAVPKYDIRPTSGYMMFAASAIEGDFDEWATACGIEADFSGCENCNYLFHTAKFDTLGVVDLSSATAIDSVFNSNALTTIRALTPPAIEMKNTCFNFSLKYLTVVGKFTRSARMQRCPLTRESIESVMTALSDDVTGQEVIFNLAAVNSVFETSEGAADGSTSDEWNTLVAGKPNWTITLAVS